MKFITRKVSECCHFVTYNKNGVDYCGMCGKPTRLLEIKIKKNVSWYIRWYIEHLRWFISNLHFDSSSFFPISSRPYITIDRVIREAKRSILNPSGKK
jgi:hypothetical protein